MQPRLADEPRFIERDMMADIFATLDDAVRRQRIVILTGPTGCGKNTLLGEWLRKNITSCRSEQVLYIRIPRIESNVPPGWTLFSQLWAQLEDLFRPTYTRLDHKERIIKQYSGRNLDSLRIQVQRAIKAHNVRAVVIANAHRLDQSALIDLLEMRSFWSHERARKPSFSLIFADRCEEKGKDSAFFRMFKKHVEVAGIWTQLQMDLIHPNEFARVLAMLFRHQLNIDFQRDINVDAEVTEAYQLTRGDWRLLADYADALDVSLGGSTEQKRTLDSVTLQRAKKRFRENTAHRPRPIEPIGLPNDFVALVSLMVTAGLNARFDEKLDSEAMAAEWFRATNGELLVLNQLVTCVSDVLSETPNEPKDSTAPRTLDQEKLNEAYRRFNEQQRTAAHSA